MHPAELRALRLHNQRILGTPWATPAEVVAHLGAMQAQEYAMAKWAIGLRLRNGDASTVEHAVQSGTILRTHMLRPTWHFVVPADIRWLLALTGPHVHRVNGTQYRKWGLDAELLRRTQTVIEQALTQHTALRRTDLAEHLAQSGIAADGQRLAYIMMHAELEGLICSGPSQGKQHTYTLLDRVVPQATPLPREKALAKFARRYFASRGPATVQDFSYWSGLTLVDARIGAADLGNEFLTEDGWIFPDPGRAVPQQASATFLMPDYDEYGMGYKDRSALATSSSSMQAASDYSHWLVLRGGIAGTWEVLSKTKRSPVAVHPFEQVSPALQSEIDDAAMRYEVFWADPEPDGKSGRPRQTN